MKISIKYISSLFLFTLLLSCGKSDQKSVELKSADQKDELAESSDLIVISKDQFQNENMKLVNLQEYSFPVQIRTTGMIDVPPNRKAVISAYAGGYIKNSPLLVGDKVKKGQALLTIENLDFIQMQQEYLEISEQLAYLKSEYDRQKELYAEKISSKKSYLKAESDYKKASAMYNGLHKKLQMLHMNTAEVKKGNFSSVVTIYAPISGSITAVHISTGVYVSPADKIMEIVNTEHIHLELKVFEKDVLKIKKGQKVTFRVPESSGESFDGEILLIGKSIDENRTVQVHAHIDHDLKQNFIVGMFVETDIVVTENVALALPESTLVTTDDKNYVLQLKSKDNENYSFFKKEVIPGEIFNGFTEIKDSSKFKETDQFLLDSFHIIAEE